MSLLLISGRPGAGKTEYCRWLVQERGFHFLETDDPTTWDTWHRGLMVQDASSATESRDRALALGRDVVIEWGFVPRLLPSVRWLQSAGFECWWFDGDDQAARQGHIARRGDTPPTMDAYSRQIDAIEAIRPELEEFYGDHIIRTVSSGPSYMDPEEIASIMLSASTD